ncbi:MAG: universal stress protein [Vicinamibacterales bacterium]
MTPAGPVLAAIDLSPYSAEVLQQGAAWARALGAPLVVCHVLPELSQVRVLFPQLAGRDAGTLTTLQDRARAAAKRTAGETLGTDLADEAVVIETGSPHAGIRAAAERCSAGLVVVGPGRTGPRVAHHAAWAVLVARPSPDGGSVLGATDFSDPALPAVEAASREAARRGVPLRLIHAIDIAPAYADGSGVGIPAIVAIPDSAFAELEKEAEADLQKALARFGASGSGARGARRSRRQHRRGSVAGTDVARRRRHARPHRPPAAAARQCRRVGDAPGAVFGAGRAAVGGRRRGRGGHGLTVAGPVRRGR